MKWLTMVGAVGLFVAAACGSDDGDAATSTSATSSGVTSGTGGQGAGGMSTSSTGGGGAAPIPTSGLVFVGSGDFGNNGTGVISVLRLDYTTGQATPLDSLTTGRLLSFMAVDDDRALLHVGDEADGTVTTYSYTSEGQLTQQAQVQSVGNPVHLALNPGRTHLFVAHYGPGRTEVIGLDANGFVEASLDAVETGGQTHSTLVPAGDHLFAASKADDQIAQLSFDGTNLTLNAPVTTANGSGPRHLAMHPNGQVVYLVNELDRTLDTFNYDSQAGTLTAAQSPIALDLPGSTANGTGADVHVHPSGDFLYVSLRRNGGLDGELVRCNLNAQGLPGAVEATSTQGRTPRNFDVSEDGEHVLVANQESDNVVVFSVGGDGALTPGVTLTVPTKPFFVTVVDE